MCFQVLLSTTWTPRPPGWRALTSPCHMPKSWRTTACRRSKTSSSLSKRPSTSDTHTHKHARILFVLFTQTLKSFEPCVNTAKRVLLKRSRLMFPTRCWRNKRTAVYLHPERWTHRVRSTRRQYWLNSVCDFGCSFHSLLFKIKVALSCRLFCVSKDVW